MCVNGHFLATDQEHDVGGFVVVRQFLQILEQLRHAGERLVREMRGCHSRAHIFARTVSLLPPRYAVRSVSTPSDRALRCGVMHNSENRVPHWSRFSFGFSNVTGGERGGEAFVKEFNAKNALEQ